PAFIGLTLFTLSGIVHWIQLCRVGKKYLLVLPIGMTGMAGGFALRFLLHHNPTSKGVLIATTLLLLLSPCLFLAAGYVILGHLGTLFGPKVAKGSMLIPPARIATIFVWSDVGTILVQGLGGSMTVSDNIDTVNLGSKIVLVGVIIQFASFMLFSLLVVVFGLRVKSRFPHIWTATGSSAFRLFSGNPAENWHILYYALCATCVTILIRSTYRMIQFLQGHGGYLASHEVFFYCLDALPLWFAMSLYCSVWPPRFLNNSREAQVIELQKGGHRSLYGGESTADLL
ncbi:RTA1 like protein-domain-containing protein, partial [Mycena maculata]